MIIEYFLPYKNFIIIFGLVILNIVLIYKRSYWQTFLIANTLFLALFAMIGFIPFETPTDGINTVANEGVKTMANSNNGNNGIIEEFFKIIGMFFEKILNLIFDLIKKIIDKIIPWW